MVGALSKPCNTNHDINITTIDSSDSHYGNDRCMISYQNIFKQNFDFCEGTAEDLTSDYSMCVYSSNSAFANDNDIYSGDISSFSFASGLSSRYKPGVLCSQCKLLTCFEGLRFVIRDICVSLACLAFYVVHKGSFLFWFRGKSRRKILLLLGFTNGKYYG